MVGRVDGAAATGAGSPDTSLSEIAGTEYVALAGFSLALAARSAADVAEAEPPTRAHLLHRLHDLGATMGADAFGPARIPAERGACAATWAAELGRLSGRQTSMPGSPRQRAGTG